MNDFYKRKFVIEDKDTGKPAYNGLTWSGEEATKSLERVRKSRPGQNWILREVLESQEK